MLYEDRIVCFVDILGFREIIESTTDVCGHEIEGKTVALQEALLATREVLDADVERISKSKVITQFSDSIVISFHVEEESEVFFTLLELLWNQVRLIFHGMVLRGGVAFGKCHHTDKLVFGPALVEAYEIESRVAKTPRIVVSESVVEEGSLRSANWHSPVTERESIEMCLAEDDDGMLFIDYFGGAQSELDDPECDFPLYLGHLRSISSTGLQNPDQEVRKKYEWMRSKFNELARACRDAEFVARLSDPDLQVAYSSIMDV